MKKKKEISLEDKTAWQNYIKDPKDVVDKELTEKKISFKERFKFDLHGYSLDEANIKVKEILLYCVEKNYKEILFITGKGIHSNTDKDIYVSKNLSKLKYAVPEFIKTNSTLASYVSSITSASQLDGGDGAIIVKLKKL